MTTFPALDALLSRGDVRRVLTLLNTDGEETRIVGGAVRDAILGHRRTDIDLATTATPPVVMARAQADHLRVIPTGIAHGTVTIRIADQSFEVTTLREDVDTDGRHATVSFSRDFAADARRRDFTINALSVGADSIIHDYTNGLADLRAGRVRFIGTPDTRIREDYLRILRFFRFSAQYAAGAFDADGLAACVRARAGLSRLSRERIRQELLKLLMATRAVEAATAMTDAGLLSPLLAGVPRPVRLARLLAVAHEADDMLRLAALAVDVEEDAHRLQDQLRLSNAQTTRLTKAARAALLFHGSVPPDLGRQREALYREGREAALDGLALARTRGESAREEGWAHAAAFLQDTPIPNFPVTGADLVARGLTSGRRLGAALKQLQADWIRAGFPTDPRSIAALLERVMGG